MIEESEDVSASLIQGPAESRQLWQALRDAADQRVDDLAQRVLPVGGVLVPVSRDQALIQAPGHLDRDVFIDGKETAESLELACSEQIEAGVKEPSCPVEGIVFAASTAMDLLLDTLPGRVQGVADELDDMERIHHRDRVRDHFRGSGLEAGETIHTHDLDAVTKSSWLLLKARP